MFVKKSTNRFTKYSTWFCLRAILYKYVENRKNFQEGPSSAFAPLPGLGPCTCDVSDIFAQVRFVRISWNLTVLFVPKIVEFSTPSPPFLSVDILCTGPLRKTRQRWQPSRSWILIAASRVKLPSQMVRGREQADRKGRSPKMLLLKFCMW